MSKSSLPANTWWIFILGGFAIISIAPFLPMKYYNPAPMTFDTYITKVIIAGAIVLPIEAALLWFSQIRSEINRRKGYDWIGKFEVLEKKAYLHRFYFRLQPGSSHKIKVSRSLYESTRIGDFILIRRNALGDTKETVRLSGIRHRIKGTVGLV